MSALALQCPVCEAGIIQEEKGQAVQCAEQCGWKDTYADYMRKDLLEKLQEEGI